MKKKIVLLSSVALTAIVLSFTGCSKDDTTAPVVTLTGDEDMEVVLNGTFSDPGATATDDEDGAVTVTAANPVDVNHTGTYTITYSATDEAGNTGQATRTVVVYNEAEIFAGNYFNSYDSCVSTPYSAYDAVVTVSETQNHHVKIQNFGAFGTSVMMDVTITDNVVGASIIMTIPQVISGNSTLELFYPNETVVTNATSGATAFDIKYKWSDGSNSDVCTSYYRR